MHTPYEGFFSLKLSFLVPDLHQTGLLVTADAIIARRTVRRRLNLLTLKPIATLC
jgi:hypothetical protein